MNLIYLLLSGFIIGICAVLPGISGTIIAMILGIYDEVLEILSKRKNIFKLIPLSIGLFCGIFLFGNIMYIFFDKYEVLIKYIFIGITISSIFSIKKEIYNKTSYSINYKYVIIALLISLIMYYLPNILNIKINNSFIFLVLAGFLYIMGKVIPGVSSSVFMMVLGLYNYVLMFLSNPISFMFEFHIYLIPFFIGILVGLIVFITVINYLFNNYYRNTYSFIIGLIIMSIIFIFPSINIYIIFLLISFIITHYLTNNN